MVLRPLPKEILDRLLQYANADSAISVTLSAIVMFVKFGQSLNASALIVVTPSSMMVFLMLLHWNIHLHIYL